MERVMRAAKNAGVTIGCIEIRPDGTLVIFAKGEEPDTADFLDTERAEWRREHGEN